jgi:hypothetical protein
MNETALDTLGRETREELLQLIQDNPELVAGFVELEPKTRHGLLEMIQDDPDLVSEFVERHSYSESGELSGAAKRIQEGIAQTDGPLDAEGVRDFLGAHDPKLFDDYGSAKHVPWIRTQLATLAEAGEIGRFRKGHSFYYTSDLSTAIRKWAIQNQKDPDDLTGDDVQQIHEDTGMPTKPIRENITE